MSRSQSGYDDLIPSEETIKNRIDIWNVMMQKFDKEETEEELNNAISVGDLGDNISGDEDDKYNSDSDDATEYEDPNSEEIDRKEVVLDAKKILKELQPIIKKRIKFYETYCERNSNKTIRTKDKLIQKITSAKNHSKFSDERTHSVHIGDTAPALTSTLVLAPIDAVASSSNIVAVTPLKEWSNKGAFQEIEETVTTTTVTTTTKKIRRVIALDRADASTEHVKRKLTMSPFDEDVDDGEEKPKRESRRKTVHGAVQKRPRTCNSLQAPSMNESIVLYDADDTLKRSKQNNEKIILQPEQLNQVILDKSLHDFDGSTTEVQPLAHAIQLNRNESLIYQKGASVDDVPRVVKEKSKVDVLHRMSLLSIPKFCIKSKIEDK